MDSGDDGAAKLYPPVHGKGDVEERYDAWEGSVPDESMWRRPGSARCARKA
jgi:hypothetical protein